MKALVTLLVLHIFISEIASQFNPVYNWFPIVSGTTNDLNSASLSFISGNNGTILKSTNNAISWIQVNPGTTANLNAVNVSGQNVVAAGNNGVIVRSTDGGQNWSVLSSGSANKINSINRVTSSLYFTAGDMGTILTTTNSGVNWTTVTSGTSVNLNSVSGAAYIYVAGNNGTILTAPYPGTTFTQVPSGTSQNLNAVDYTSSTAVAVGAGGTIVRSTDNGATWQQMVSGTTAELNSIDILNSSMMCAAGNGIVLSSTNNGTTWSVISDFRLPSLNWKGVYVYNLNEVYVAGQTGKIYRKTYDSSYAQAFTIDANSMKSYIWNSGVFNQNKFINNSPGCEWPIHSGKFAIFTTGLTTAAYVNGSLRMAAASYLGELMPGYCVNGNFMSDSRFKLYKVDTDRPNDSDYINWGRMVPFGAPFTDINSNGTYEPGVDKPGVKGAKQTIYICMSDANPLSHVPNEGFGGGTNALGAEYHFTIWAYNIDTYKDMIFMKWVIINKSTSAWDSTYFSMVSDPDLGDAEDDYIGCDTTRNLSYCYNADNHDGDGSGHTYGQNPPAVGMSFLNCSGGNAVISSMTFFTNSGSPGPVCERDPTTAPEAYTIMKGLKKDGTRFVIPNTNPPAVTKFVYSGNPELSSGWTEFSGKVENCGGSLNGNLVVPAPPGDRRIVMSYKPNNQRLNPNDSQVIITAQVIARGTSNLNSVAVLKQQTDIAKLLCNNNFIIGITPISNEIPKEFNLYQNYPNPFNPVTKIKFDLPRAGNVTVKIFDVSGREVAVLVNEKLNSGVYSIDWNGAGFSSGVYFYSIHTGDYTMTRKMVLVK